MGYLQQEQIQDLQKRGKRVMHRHVDEDEEDQDLFHRRQKRVKVKEGKKGEE